MALCPAIIDTDIRVLDKASFAQALLDCAQGVRLYMRRPAAKEPDHRHRCLLCPHRDWPRCRRAAKRANECSPLDVICHSTLPQGSCNAGNNITPRRAALREFDPAYVSCGSQREVALFSLMSA